MSLATFANPTVAEHKASVDAVDGTIIVSIGEIVLAETERAVHLFEQSARGKYPPVLYVPKDDVSGDLVPIADKSTHCPLKGDASYLSFDGNEVAWIYDRPLKDAAIMSNYVGFYSDKVKIGTA